MRRAALLLLAAGCASPGVRERRPDEALAEGTAFLLRTQNPDGSLGSGRGSSTFDVMADVPGSHDAFRVGATALAAMALDAVGEPDAARRALGYLVGYDGIRRANRREIYNVWAHTYSLQALARATVRYGDPRYREAAIRHLRHLERYETFAGGWNYYDFVYGTRTPSMEPTSFGTAAALVALHEAREAGIPVAEPLVTRALARLREMRKPDGSFLYSSDFRYHPAHFANRASGSLGRTQSCFDALRLWDPGSVTPREIRDGLERMLRDHRFMDVGRKRQYPHEAWYFTSGYYYYFGHYYAARLIARMDAPGDLPGRLLAHVLPHQEPDGSWWDYRMWDYHKPYGTAFALLTIVRCREAAARS